VSDAADLVCFDDKFGLELGWFWNTAAPRYMFLPGGAPASGSGELSRALWRMVSEHLDHDLRLVGERTPAWDDADLDEFVLVGGDRTLGTDPPVAQYVAGWPATLADESTGLEVTPEPAYVVCSDDRLALPLGWVRPDDGDGRCLRDAAGVPAFKQDDRNRSLWKMLADHVYHDVRFAGERKVRIDLAGYSVINDLPDFLLGWPG
jgi:hypothetical protein